MSRSVRAPVTLLAAAALFLVAVAAGRGPAATAQPAGTWTLTGSMSVERERHTATLLQNGKVLVAGGIEGFTGFASHLDSAELYDPATGAWTATGSMNTARSNATATRLPDGRVLIVGGVDSDDQALDSAELYDPATGAWQQTGAMSTARSGHTSILLRDGRVLVVGGLPAGRSGSEAGPPPPPLASAELFDPATGTWTPTGSLNVARSGHTATLLADGRVLVDGGQDIGRYILGRPALASAELYNPATGLWSLTGSMAGPRSYHAASVLRDGRVLVVGGEQHAGMGDVNAAAELYDPATGAWSVTGAPLTLYVGASAILLPSGNVLVVTGDEIGSAELYDPASATWQPAGTLNRIRHYAPATLLANGTVLVEGGSVYRAGDASAELYDPAAVGPPPATPGRWTATGSMAAARGNHTATLLPDGRVLVVGGWLSDHMPLASAELYDPTTGAWTPAAPLHTPRAEHTATLLQDGRVLVVGGAGDFLDAVASAEIYDPATDLWSPAGSMSTPRLHHTATLLPDGRVLVAGGVPDELSPALASAEIYDPTTGTWSSAGNMSVPRQGFTASLLADGTVLVAGGLNTSPGVGRLQTYASAERYDPASGTWTATSDMTAPRVGHIAIVLLDGRVLVVGGGTDGELYDPTTGGWTPAGTMGGPRAADAATLLSDGRVLISGSEDGVRDPRPVTELYDPATGTAMRTASPEIAHRAATATLLPDGRVLLAGGVDLAVSELYDASHAP